MTKAHTTTMNKDKIICLSLFGVVIAGITFYLYFLSASIVHVVIRKEINQDLVLLHTEIGQLESEYIDAQHRVSAEIASLEGYTTVAEKIFIDRSAGSLVLSGSVQ